MKVVIRHPMTRLYLRKDGTWVKDWAQAYHFPDSFEGANFCTAEKLDAFQVVIKHPEDEKHDVVVLERTAKSSQPPADSRMHLFSQKSPKNEPPA